MKFIKELFKLLKEVVMFIFYLILGTVVFYAIVNYVGYIILAVVVSNMFLLLYQIFEFVFLDKIFI